jgi:hypothetical protein
MRSDPGVLVRLVGRALGPEGTPATVYELEKLPCGLCLEVFTVPPPPEAGDKKYDETAASTIAALKCGTGAPLNLNVWTSCRVIPAFRCRPPRNGDGEINSANRCGPASKN